MQLGRSSLNDALLPSRDESCQGVSRPNHRRRRIRAPAKIGRRTHPLLCSQRGGNLGRPAVACSWQASSCRPKWSTLGLCTWAWQGGAELSRGRRMYRTAKAKADPARLGLPSAPGRSGFGPSVRCFSSCTTNTSEPTRRKFQSQTAPKNRPFGLLPEDPVVRRHVESKSASERGEMEDAADTLALLC